MYLYSVYLYEIARKVEQWAVIGEDGNRHSIFVQRGYKTMEVNAKSMRTHSDGIAWFYDEKQAEQTRRALILREIARLQEKIAILQEELYE